MKSKIGLVLDVDFKPFNPIDRSVYGHVLTNYGSQWNLNGRSFDGVDDYVDAGSATSLQLTDNFTFEFWIKMNNLSGAFLAAISNGWEPIMWSNYGGKFSWGIDLGGGDAVRVDAINATQVGVWYHLAGTYNTADGGSAAKFYINGILQGSAVKTIAALTPSGSVYIGKHTSQANSETNGTIDEVQIWDRALSASEVQQLYLEGKKKGRV